jgi:mannosyltransferase
VVAAAALIVLLVSTAFAVRLARRATGLGPVVVGLSWTVLPPTVLWTISQWRPLWLGRYLVPVLPGVALAGSWVIMLGARWLRGGVMPSGRRLPVAPALVATAAVAGLAVLSFPKQVGIRSPLGHSEDVRQVSAYLAEAARPGDGVLFLPDDLRIIGLLDPEHVAALDDVALGRSAAESATISGRDVTPAAVPGRLASRTRVWVIHIGGFIHDGAGSSDPAKVEALNKSFRRESSTLAGGFSVDLYRRVS